MEIATLLPVVAGGAIGLAVLTWILGRASQKAGPPNERPVPGVTPKGPPPPMPPAPKKIVNRRGWRAPNGYHFNDADELVSITGDLILDLMIVADLCDASYDGGSESAPEEVAVESECCSEVKEVAPEPVAAEVSPYPVASDLPTADDTTFRHSAPEPASYGGSDSDSGGCDSGGGGDD